MAKPKIGVVFHPGAPLAGFEAFEAVARLMQVGDVSYRHTFHRWSSAWNKDGPAREAWR